MNRILLDMDGVLSDFISGACSVHSKSDPYEGGCNLGDYDIAALLEMTPGDFWLPMGKDFWASLPPFPEAFELVAFLESLFGQENICILSSPNLNPESMQGKLEWIERHFPKYRRQYLFGPRKQFCAGLGHILIDDHDVNVQVFNDAGGVGVLYPRPWNSRHGLSRVQSLEHVMHSVLSRRVVL